MNIINIESEKDDIKEFQLLEKSYNKFYNETVNTVKLLYFYINEDNTIYNIKSEYELLDNSCLTKERLIYLIKKNQCNLCNKHKLIGLLKYNIDFDHTDLQHFLSDKIANNFFISLKIIDDIKFNKTISFLHDLNCVIFLFSNNIPSIHNNTKKINITTNKSKTRRYKSNGDSFFKPLL